MDHNDGHRHGNCRCAGAPMERFIQPCLLLLLHQRPAHGYELIHKLKEFHFTDNEADPGTVYRNLRRMEMEGLISSRWDTSGGGPAKRLYHLTPEGEELLHAWAESVEMNKRRLENFLHSYQREFNR